LEEVVQVCGKNESQKKQERVRDRIKINKSLSADLLLLLFSFLRRSNKTITNSRAWQHGNNQQQTREKKRKQRIEMERDEEDCAKEREEEDCAKEREGEDCAQSQQSAQNEGSGWKVAKTEHCKLEMKVNEVVDGPDHCIHCDEEPCVFIQIESRLCENDEVYFNKEDYAKDHVAYNSGRLK
jgi:hypothetical protein